MDSAAQTNWVRLTSFLGLYGETEANLLVAYLQGNEIPAFRLPVEPQTMMVGAPVVILPISVIVPADRADEAAAFLAEQTPLQMPEPVRAVAQWYTAINFMSLVVGALFAVSHRGRESFHDNWLMGGAMAIAYVALFVVGVQALVALRREGRSLPGLRVVMVAVMCWLVLALVIMEWTLLTEHLMRGFWLVR